MQHGHFGFLFLLTKAEISYQYHTRESTVCQRLHSFTDKRTLFSLIEGTAASLNIQPRDQRQIKPETDVPLQTLVVAFFVLVFTQVLHTLSKLSLQVLLDMGPIEIYKQIQMKNIYSKLTQHENNVTLDES